MKPRYNRYGMTQWYWIVRHRRNFKLGKDTQIGSFTLIDAGDGVEIQDKVKVGWGSVILSYSSIDDKRGYEEEIKRRNEIKYEIK